MEPLFWPKKNELPIRNLRLKLSQGQLFWREVGYSDSTVVLLHGSWGDGTQWQPLLKILGRRCHCLAPDLIGWGESSRLRPLAYSIDLEVDCLAELFEALRISSVCLVGHSLGAWVATRYALKYPEQVKGIVVLEAEGFDCLALTDRWRGHRRLLNPLMGLWIGCSKLLMARLGKTTAWLRSHHQRQQLLRYTAACRLLFRRRRPALAAEQLKAPLNGLTAPLLILQAEHASSEIKARDDTYLTAIPHANLKLFLGIDDLTELQPEVLATEIANFVTHCFKTLRHDSTGA